MKKTHLVVVVPGLGATMTRWEPFLSRLRQEAELGQEFTEWLLYDPKSRPLGFQRAANMARNLVALINAKWIEHGGFDEILMVGHSLGGMVVRSAYVMGCGADPTQPEKYEWAAAVHRIVLLASPNRGIQGLRYFFLNLLDWCVKQLPLTFTYQDLQRGSEFVTNLRINWIRLFSKKGGRKRHLQQAKENNILDSEQSSPLPRVVQVVGTEDKIVRRDDSIDVLSLSTADAVEVADAGHDDLPCLTNAKDPESRYLILKTAILNPDGVGVRTGSPPLWKLDEFEHIVFILHGIRASNIDQWLREVAEEVRKVYPAATHVIRPAYGYFTALSFALPAVRRKNIRRFQDAYTQALARNPNAIFDFVGHSNGTYMLGQSLRDISGMQFRNVILAGSVLPPDFPWDGKMGVQVQRVRSERGRMDWPVGWLCSALNGGLGMSDVGTGGYSGFISGTVEEEWFHPGGHGSMFNSKNIQRMARWLCGNDPGAALPRSGFKIIFVSN